VSKRWRDLIRSSDYAAFKAREGWCGDWLFVPSHNAGLDAEQKRTKKKGEKDDYSGFGGMAVPNHWNGRALVLERERGERGEEKVKIKNNKIILKNNI
jgi:hypothetical protein